MPVMVAKMVSSPPFLGIDARHDFGATLTVKDRTGRNEFAIPGFAAESPTGRITAVLGARNALFGSEELEIDIELHELYFLSSLTPSGWEDAKLVNCVMMVLRTIASCSEGILLALREA
jgi:hypothetical protein